ncbi:hypothetical protein M1N58_02325 [Dehalococcoidales bacterium]|nr:hypothetical protein [Dehalococcoidales bacterium]
MRLYYKTARTKKIDDRVLYKIIFEDEKGHQYSWMPKWKDFATEFFRGFLVELRNGCALVDKAIRENDEAKCRELLRKLIFEGLGPFWLITMGIRDEFDGKYINIPKAFEKAVLEGVVPSFPLVEEVLEK